MLEGHSNAVTAIAFEPTAGMLAVCKTFGPNMTSVRSGTKLVSFSVSDGTLRVWQAGGGGPFGIFSVTVGVCIKCFQIPVSPPGSPQARGSASLMSYRCVRTLSFHGCLGLILLKR